ncbi:MAG: hypothetical protein LBG79_03880 [Spirochaetaceae bacterium]|nr:hypothetical protein [Spirochaetaceae bacterium]GMO30236.1 MAG: zinc ribbon domain-containing protein [Termitinemataceae bacterium]
MPTYEYQCQNCGNQFEAFQSMKDEPLTSCPECGGGVKRVVSGGAGVIFKGSGFYTTDKGPKPEKTSKKDKGNQAPCGAKEAKPACANCPAASGAT